MGEAIGQVLSLGVAVAISPLAIIAVTLMLVAPHGRVTAPSFLAGWLLGLVVVGAVVLLVVGPAEIGAAGQPEDWVSWVLLVVGMLLLLVAWRQWRGRPRGDDIAKGPKWMAAVRGFTALQAFGFGALFSGGKPKNLLLAIGAAVEIGQTGIPGGEQALAYAAFVAIGTVGVAVPLVLYVVLGERAGSVLGALERWMIDNNAVVITVLCVVAGVKLIGDGIAGL